MKRLGRRKSVNNKRRMIYFSLFFVFLFISMGYAYLNTSLSITGDTTIAGNTWDIHFENLNVSENSVSATVPASIQDNGTSVKYSAVLGSPGDYYEFSVDVVNAGTLPGKISSVNIGAFYEFGDDVFNAGTLPGKISSVNIKEITPEDPEDPDYLDYYITYINGVSVQNGDLLNPGSRKRIVVRIQNDSNLSIAIDVTYTIDYIQTNEIEINAGNIIQNLAAQNSTCITKYEGQITDRVGETVTASNVYFDKCSDKRNVIFGGFCWQVIRTTESGGLKMIYNGEVVDGKCESNRGDHIGVIQSGYSSIINLNSNYLYGNSFDYNTNTNEFTLLDTSLATWSDSTYGDLVGKFTCLNTSGTCTNIYVVNSYETSNSAVLSSYVIGNTHYSQIGTGAFNANYRGPANVGYMFNKVYNYSSKEVSEITGNNLFASSFTYDSSTNTYTLTGNTNAVNNWTQALYSLNNTRYTCWNSNGICQTISYVSYYDDEVAYYFNINDGKSATDILEEMLANNDVNRYNSTAKALIDNWYDKNLGTKTDLLEDVVHCNNRDIISYGAWDQNGVNNSGNYYIQFKNFNQSSDLTCQNVTDQFAVSNNLAKLIYPVGLLQVEEINNINSNALINAGYEWWSMSPVGYGYSGTYVKSVENGGSLESSINNAPFGLRPVISLSSLNRIISGSGSEVDPWIVG